MAKRRRDPNQLSLFDLLGVTPSVTETEGKPASRPAYGAGSESYVSCDVLGSHPNAATVRAAIAAATGHGFGDRWSDPWAAWLARPNTDENRLDDLTMQIKRDCAALKDPAVIPSTRAFIAKRIEKYRADAKKLAEAIACASSSKTAMAPV